MSQTTGRPAMLAVLGMLVLTGLVVAYTAWGHFPLRVDDWAWHRLSGADWASAAPTLAIFALMGLLAILGARCAPQWSPARRALAVAALAALAFAAQVSAARQLPGGYNESIVALGKPGANRYHAAARGVQSLRAVLGDYPRWMRDRSHKLIITHPAGPLTLFWSLNRVFAGAEGAARGFVHWCEDRFAWGIRAKDPQGPVAMVELFRKMPDADLAGVWLASFVLRLAAALVVLPVYAFAGALHGVSVGIVAAALAGMVPSFLLFSPGIDQALPVLATTACWLGWTAGTRRSLWRAGCAGLTVSVGLFFSLSFLVVAGWAGLLAMASLFGTGGRPSVRTLLWLAVTGAIGLAAPAVTLYLATGYNSLAVAAACVGANAEFNAKSGRAYGTWLWVNPIEFLVFLGVPSACLFVARAAGSVGGLCRRRWGEADWPTVIVVVLVVALNLLGVNRGEVARLWMFLMPGCLIAAAAQVERYAPYRRVVLVALLALQALQATALKSLLDTLLGFYRGLG
ncbi:MAG TPA: hypothetical protein PLE19_19495 [Planctomycetota bacterium]|nr:hypothetical protein [Planctomycetota bacterium]HRR81255.1 hypothetical protein [Planctomycetota bacterium]HRT94672.1 hypothetical protein [Planctomycetota bacterium]